MSEPLDPLPPGLSALLESERERPLPSTSVAERVLARVELSAAAAAAAALAAAASSAAPPSAPAQTPSALGTVAGTGAPGALLTGSRLISAALVGLGMAGGAGLHAALAPPVERVRVVERLVQVSVAVPAAAPEPPAAVPSASGKAVTPAATPRKAVEDQGARRDAALAEENALIAQAQAALGRRDPTQALVALRSHQRKFPTGQLSVERDALLKQALRATPATPSPEGTPAP